MITVKYMYKKYPNCPRATEYSKSSEELNSYLWMMFFLLAFGAAIMLFYSSFLFVTANNWAFFGGAVAAAFVAAFAVFYLLVCKPRSVDCELHVILVEESTHQFPDTIVRQYCRELRKKARRQNARAILTFISIFVPSLLVYFALVEVTKNVYLLCHRQGNPLFLIISFLGLILFGLLLWRMIFSAIVASKKSVSSNDELSSSNSFTESAQTQDQILYCHKCGTKILPDSTYCVKCGQKVR